jgi:ferric-dicitrate binding protein FerR (iron transport regulator)
MKHKEVTKNINSLITDESFQLHISGQGSKRQNRKWEAWCKENPENSKIYNEALNLWHAGQFKNHPVPDVQREWQKIDEKLNLKYGFIETKNNKSYTNIFSLYNYRIVKISAAVISAAAILLIALNFNLSIFNFIYSPFDDETYTSISTNFGERTKLNLGDGSVVILNANSYLRYPAKYNSETKRDFYLQGEAYFRVAKKPAGVQQKFTVSTDQGLITVLGTRFTVNSRKNQTEVVLISGSVKAMAKTELDSQKISASVIMKPGEFLYFKKNAQDMKSQKVTKTLQTSWWKDQLVLNKTSLKELIIRLKETYGIEVEIKDDRLLERTITGSIENRDLNLIIETLGKVLQAPVYIKGNTVIFGKTNA